MPEPPTPRWQVPVPQGETEAVKAMGTTGATLLGGFSLATLALLVTAEQQPPLWRYALIGFAAASVLFIFSVQFTSAGLSFSATPDERLMWLPKARTDVDALARVERIQRMDARLQRRYFLRARVTYRLGLISFLAGTILICTPDTLDWPRIAAAAVAGAALVVEAVWLVANMLRRHPRWLLPSYRDPGVWEDVPRRPR